MAKPADTRFVWYDSRGEGRNLFGLFRRTFTVDKPVSSARISIFADTSYQLFVNGTFVDFGPVRCDPRFPVYDTHELKPLLKKGLNVIAIRVNYFGHKTYKAMPVRAGLAAWGSVESADGAVVDLGTGTSPWRAVASRSLARYMPKLSFALNAAEIFDQCADETDWHRADFDDGGWPAAVELEAQESWGAPAPRSITFMSGRDVPVESVVAVLPLRALDDRYSFSVPFPDHYEEGRGRRQRHIVITTWIHSPKAQTVDAGVFWSDAWLNGKPLARGLDSTDKPMYICQQWPLEKGWNQYVCRISVYADILDHYLSVPKSGKLALSADRDKESKTVFRYTTAVDESIETLLPKGRPLPFSAGDITVKFQGWVAVDATMKAQSPCRETGWDDYGQPFEILTPQQLEGHAFTRRDYPSGFSLLLDFGQMNLVLPQLRMAGVAGATIDLTWTEHLMRDNLHFRHEHHHAIGDRVICAEDRVDWLPNHPRGGRYVKLTVRGASRDVVIEQLRFRSANYPVTLKGRFSCSDPLLNEIWAMGCRTQAVNMEDAYVDCSGRERGMYGRDTIIQYHVNLASFGDHALMRRCLELYGQSPDATGKFRAVYPNTGDYTIADFALNMLEGYLAYYENTGDAGLIKTYWDAMLKNLQWFHALADERDDLLLDSEWDRHKGVSAHYGGFHGDLGIVKGHMVSKGVHCVFSCTYLIAMQCAMKLAAAIGRTEAAPDLRRRIDTLTRTIPEKFWDPQKQCFSDNLERESHSVHANLFAVRAGVVDKRQGEAVRSYVGHALRSLFVNGYGPSAGVYVSPSFAFYILDGLYRAGLAATAENLMRDGWGWALAQGMRTCPEYFTMSASLCHAWSASPTWYLSKYGLGVHFPKAPDFSLVRIRPVTARLTWAEGAVPHPMGAVEVRWHLDGGKRVFDYIRAPQGVTVEVEQE